MTGPADAAHEAPDPTTRTHPPALRASLLTADGTPTPLHPHRLHDHRHLLHRHLLHLTSSIPPSPRQTTGYIEKVAWIEAIREAIPGWDAAEPSARKSIEVSPVLQTAELQGWLTKRAVHNQKERWQRRWMALQGPTLFWFSGYYKVKGQLVLTPGTRLQELGPRPHAFSIATPEMERAGLFLGVAAADAATKTEWVEAITAQIRVAEGNAPSRKFQLTTGPGPS